MTLSKQEVVKQFLQALQDCRNLYVQAGLTIVNRYPHLIPDHQQDFVAMMDDLHKGLLIKLFVAVSDSDMDLSREETWLVNLLLHHTWRQSLQDATLSQVLTQVRQESAALRWYSLIRPFDELPPLREQIGDLETLIFRVANLVAKADGVASPSEMQVIDKIQRRIAGLLHGVTGSTRTPAAKSPAAASTTVSAIATESRQVRETCRLDQAEPLELPTDRGRSSGPSLEQALAELDSLVGMEAVKEEVRTLINFLELQRKRTQADLPSTSISLHMVFKGNPGTGKTTIARILGDVYGAMRILNRGHLVETDRSGLVAQYAGQTAPKTNAKIDEALDGILFIDEAYGLVAEQGDDPFGAEAVQTLLKRMEDDRERLVVILAGYPDKMDRLLDSNPGLRSRFNQVVEFCDYGPSELGRIFGILCERNHYELVSQTRAKLLVGLNWSYQHREAHFGNGRMVRNSFERSIRRLANRVANEAEISRETLVRILPADIELPGVPQEELMPERLAGFRFAVDCRSCGKNLRFGPQRLGKKFKCPACETVNSVDWPEPIEPSPRA